MSFEFGEVFTVAARHVVPVARSRGFSFAFDCQIGRISLTGDPEPLQGALHKLFLEVLGLMQSGSLTISASMPPGHEEKRLCIHVGGVGALVCEELMAQARERLQLVMSTTSENGFTARGVCSRTSGAVEMSTVDGQGILITLELTSFDEHPDDNQPTSTAHNARAWLVNVDDVLATAWTRRLQRLDWAVSRFFSYEAAAQQLRDAPQAARPALVIVLETADPASDGTLDLPSLFPVWTRFVYAVETGSLTLRHPAAVAGYEVHVYPLSPDQLGAFTDEASDQELGSGTTMPMPLTAHDMPSICAHR